jgi:hypothetical protein
MVTHLKILEFCKVLPFERVDIYFVTDASGSGKFDIGAPDYANKT